MSTLSSTSSSGPSDPITGCRVLRSRHYRGGNPGAECLQRLPIQAYLETTGIQWVGVILLVKNGHKIAIFGALPTSKHTNLLRK